MFTSSTPFPSQSLRISSRRRPRTPEPSSSSNNFLSSDNDSGSWLVSNAVSSICLTSSGFSDSVGSSTFNGIDRTDINYSEYPVLGNLYLMIPNKLQQRQKSND